MNQTPDQARDDLAFLRTVVAEGQPFGGYFGLVYGVAGLLYGVQCAITIPALIWDGIYPTYVHIIIGALPTVLFLALVTYTTIKDMKTGLPRGPVPRAITAAFSGTGLANLAMVIVFGAAAFRRDDASLWLFYGSVVCAIQGAVWYGGAVLRRRRWMGLVAGGWIASALLSGLFVDNLIIYLAVLTFALFAFMAAPGLAMMHKNKRSTAGA